MTLNKSIDLLMKTHDRDSSGYLDKKETRSFLSEIITNMGMKDTMSKDDFDEIYAKFDLNGDGMIQKIEIKQLMMTMLGLHLDEKDQLQQD
jgi:Ca2+-binding EF-hand superfamily protein